MKKENSKKVKAVSLINIPDYVPDAQQEVTFNTPMDWDGDRLAEFIGRILDDGTVESFYIKDHENNNTEIFDKLRNDTNLIQKHYNFMQKDTGKLLGATGYYIPWKVVGHSSDLPTVVDTYIDHCMNVRYEVAYEILFVAEEEYRKYITIQYTTEGPYTSTFFDQLEGLESMIEEMIEDNENGLWKEDGTIYAAFYNDIGEKLNAEIESLHALLGMITSVRVIKCESTIIDRKI